MRSSMPFLLENGISSRFGGWGPDSQAGRPRLLVDERSPTRYGGA